MAQVTTTVEAKIRGITVGADGQTVNVAVEAEIVELEDVESGEFPLLPIAALEKINLTPRDLLLLESFIVEPASASSPSLLDPTP